jgi:hypothetical protein
MFRWLFLSFLATATAANASLSSNAVYQEWLRSRSTEYTNALFVPADNGVNGVAIHWTISDDNTTLHLAIAAEASGWVGFGVSRWHGKQS